jgi:hypothetical protein
VAKKTVKKKAMAKPATIQLETASASRRKAVVRDINKILGDHGVKAKLTELHLTSVVGEAKRIVCRKQPDGRIVCKEE